MEEGEKRKEEKGKCVRIKDGSKAEPIKIGRMTLAETQGQNVHDPETGSSLGVTTTMDDDDDGDDDDRSCGRRSYVVGPP